MPTFMENPAMSPDELQKSMEYVKALRGQQPQQSNMVGGVFVQPQPGTAGGGGAGLNDAMGQLGSMFAKPKAPPIQSGNNLGESIANSYDAAPAGWGM